MLLMTPLVYLLMVWGSQPPPIVYYFDSNATMIQQRAPANLPVILHLNLHCLQDILLLLEGILFRPPAQPWLWKSSFDPGQGNYKDQNDG